MVEIFPMTVLNEKQAYEAMFFFLDKRYHELKEGALGSLLGDMSTLDDGFPTDPAIQALWNEAVQFSLTGQLASRLQLTKR